MAIHRFTASSPYVEVTLQVNGLSGNFIALIDTGASMSALHPDIIEGFGSRPIGGVDVRRVQADGTSVEQSEPTYLFDMAFDEDLLPAPVEVVAAVPASPCDMLIGRDYLGQWLMAWDGPKDVFVISY